MLNIGSLFDGREIPMGPRENTAPFGRRGHRWGCMYDIDRFEKTSRAKTFLPSFLPWVMEAKHMMSRRGRRMEGGAAD